MLSFHRIAASVHQTQHAHNESLYSNGVNVSTRCDTFGLCRASVTSITGYLLHRTSGATNSDGEGCIWSREHNAQPQVDKTVVYDSDRVAQGAARCLDVQAFKSSSTGVGGYYVGI